MQLYTYFRSTAAYRIRIALQLKNLDVQLETVNLVKGEQRAEQYLGINPQGLVPALGTDTGEVLNQSMAILEYLEEQFPQVPLLPHDAVQRAEVRSLCYEIACDIHPLNNLRVLKYLEGTLGVQVAEKQQWYEHWISMGFTAIERRLSKHRTADSNSFCFGDSPTLADCVLIPQVFNAHRFNCDMSAFPLINAINEHCLTLDAFRRAAPDQQPDAV